MTGVCILEGVGQLWVLERGLCLQLLRVQRLGPQSMTAEMVELGLSMGEMVIFYLVFPLAATCKHASDNSLINVMVKLAMILNFVGFCQLFVGIMNFSKHYMMIINSDLVKEGCKFGLSIVLYRGVVLSS